MAYHISPKTHKPERCVAKIGCRYGAGVKHFGTLREAEDYQETQYEQEYAKKAQSPLVARRIRREHEQLNHVDNPIVDAELQGIIDSSTRSRTMVMTLASNGNYAEYPVRKLRYSNRADVTAAVKSYDDTMSYVDGIKDPEQKLAVLYSNRDRIDADYEALRKSIDLSGVDADTIYEGHNGGSFVIGSYATVDVDAMAADGVNVDEYRHAVDQIDETALKKAVVELGDEGKSMLDRNTIFFAQKKSYNELNSDPRGNLYQSTTGGIAAMSEAHKRALLCETGLMKKNITERIDRSERDLRKAGVAEHKDEGWYFRKGNGKIGFTARTSTTVNHAAAAKHFGNLDFAKRSVGAVTVDAVKEKYGYRYLKPAKRLYFRDISSGEAERIPDKPKTAYSERPKA